MCREKPLIGWKFSVFFFFFFQFLSLPRLFDLTEGLKGEGGSFKCAAALPLERIISDEERRKVDLGSQSGQTATESGDAVSVSFL